MDVNAPELDWLVSVDDHVIEPPNVWVDRVPGQVPRRRPAHARSTTRGCYEDKRVPHLRALGHDREAQGGVHAEPGAVLGDAPPPRTTRRARSSTWTAPGSSARSASRRSRASAARCSGRRKDKDLALLCVQSYNDWMIDEWCGAVPGRFIPLIIIPLWDPAAAAVEMERCAARARRAFAFSENPEPLGLPTIHDPNRYWDPVMAAAQDLQMVVSHARRLVVDDAGDLVGRARARQPHLRRGPRRGHDAGVAVQRRLRAHARAEDRAVGGEHRLDAVLHRARRAGHRQAAALGEEHQHRVLRERGRDRAGDGRPRPPRRARHHPRPHLRLLHRGVVGAALARHHR